MVYSSRIVQAAINQIRSVQNSVDRGLDVLIEQVIGVTICSVSLLTE